MHIIKKIFAVTVTSIMVLSCKNEANPEVKTIEVAATPEAKATLDPNATYAKVEFTIEGMTCAMGCAKTIENKIAKMTGVKSSVVDFDKQLAMVEYDVAKVTPETLEQTVVSVSDQYKVKNIKTITTLQ